MYLQNLYYQLDGIIIWFYRIPDVPIVGYLLGTGVLALGCVVLGQLTMAIAFGFNRDRLESDNANMVRMHNLSMFALFKKNKAAYKACNKEANEAFGKFFFSQIALGISSLWPIPFALGWMQTRFMDVTFELPMNVPGFGDSVGYTFTFILIYILMYMGFGKIKSKLPYFKSRPTVVGSESAEPLLSIEDLYEQKAQKT